MIEKKLLSEVRVGERINEVENALLLKKIIAAVMSFLLANGLLDRPVMLIYGMLIGKDLPYDYRLDGNKVVSPNQIVVAEILFHEVSDQNMMEIVQRFLDLMKEEGVIT